MRTQGGGVGCDGRIGRVAGWVLLSCGGDLLSCMDKGGDRFLFVFPPAVGYMFKVVFEREN